MAEYRCPECGDTVSVYYTCHTWRGSNGRYMSCLPCDSAVQYICDNLGEGYCDWPGYTHGLNPGNPRSEENEKNKPEWITWDDPFEYPRDQIDFVG